MSTIREDAWLAESFGHPVFAVDVSDQTTALFAAHCGELERSGGRAFYYAKVPLARVDQVAALSSAGMYVVDAATTLERDGDAPPPPDGPASVHVTDAEPAHAGAVERIGATAFVYSRFHLDHAIPNAVANEVKRRWVRSYLDGARGHALLVALCDGAPAGFLAVLRSGEGPAAEYVIDLTAVDATFRRRGVGRALTVAFVRRFGDDTRLVVGTQLANAPSLRLYQSCGFVVTGGRYVMHKHVPGPA